MRMFAEPSRSFYVHCISRQRGIADDGKLHLQSRKRALWAFLHLLKGDQRVM